METLKTNRMSKHKDDISSQEYLQHAALKEHRTLALADVSGRGREVHFEVNWNTLVKKKGYIRVKVDGHDAVIDRDQLWTILFMLGSAEEQEKLVSPFMKQTSVTKYFKMIGVTTTRDIKKGETINVPLDFTYNPESGKITIGKGDLGHIRKAVRRQLT